jgi:hypothetical protein
MKENFYGLPYGLTSRNTLAILSPCGCFADLRIDFWEVNPAKGDACPRRAFGFSLIVQVPIRSTAKHPQVYSSFLICGIFLTYPIFSLAADEICGRRKCLFDQISTPSLAGLSSNLKT